MKKNVSKMNYNLYNKLLFFIMAIGTIIIAIMEMGSINKTRFITFIIIYPMLLVPLIIKKIKLKIKDDKIFLYLIFIFIADFLGCVVNLYNTVSWFDLFAHFLSGIFTFILGLIIYDKIAPNNKNKVLKTLFCLGIVAIIIVVWEIIEFTGDNLIGSNLQHNLDTGVNDTMTDMIVALLGGILSSVYTFFKRS